MTKIFVLEDNFNSLRKLLAERTAPVIPYLGMFLSDLTFKEAEPNYLDNFMVNFAKMRFYPFFLFHFYSFFFTENLKRAVTATITRLQDSQKTPYCLEPVYLIQEYITTLQSIDEDQFYSYSLLCEPKPDKKQKLVPQVSEPKFPDVIDPSSTEKSTRKARASTQIDRFLGSAEWVCLSFFF